MFGEGERVFGYKKTVKAALRCWGCRWTKKSELPLDTP